LIILLLYCITPGEGKADPEMEDYKAWLRQGATSPSSRDIISGQNQMRESNASVSPGGSSRQSNGSTGSVAYMAATGKSKGNMFHKKPQAMNLGSPRKTGSPSTSNNNNPSKDELTY